MKGLNVQLEFTDPLTTQCNSKVNIYGRYQLLMEKNRQKYQMHKTPQSYKSWSRIWGEIQLIFRSMEVRIQIIKTFEDLWEKKNERKTTRSLQNCDVPTTFLGDPENHAEKSTSMWTALIVIKRCKMARESLYRD